MKKILFLLLMISTVAVAQPYNGNGTGLATGNITTQNLNPLSGVPTTGSFVRLNLGNHSTLAIDVSGTYTGALSLQYSTDGGSTWVTVTNTFALTLQTSNTKSATIASASVGKWVASVPGWESVRLSGLAAMTGTAVVRMKSISAAEILSFDESLPAGTNIIGALSANQSSNIAQINGVTPLMGNGTTGTGSQRVTIASDNTAFPISTVTTLTTLTTLANGQTAHSAASTGSPLRGAGRVVPTTIAGIDASLAAGEAADLPSSTGNQLIVKQFGTAELDYTFNLITAATVTTLQPLVLASGTANVRNYITSLIIQSDVLGAAGNVWILDGQGAIGTSVTIATPGVFTSTAHDLKVGSPIVFTSLGTITGISTNTIYYVTATSFAATTFTISTTPGGTALAITGTTSAFTFYRVLQPFRFQTTAIGTPAQITYQTPIKSIANGAINVLIPTSLTSGNIYITANGFRNF